MATDTPYTGAPLRAPAFPNLDRLDDVSAVLERLDGSLHVLAEYLERRRERDGSLFAYAAAYAAEAARKPLGELYSELLAYRQELR